MGGGAGSARARLTFVAAGKAKCGHCPDDAEDVMRYNGIDLALPWIGLQKRQAGARRGDDLLLLRTRELTKQRLRDCRWRLDGQ